MQPILAGQTALVTGASAGIGHATALALARAGADLAVNYLTYAAEAGALAEQVRKLGRRAALYQVDVADQQAVETMTAQAAAEFGRLDIFVSNAAHSDEDLFYRADMAGFRRTIDVTMWGAFYTLRAATRQMIAQGGGGRSTQSGSDSERTGEDVPVAGSQESTESSFCDRESRATSRARPSGVHAAQGA